MQLVREALVQSCPQDAPVAALLTRAGIDPQLLQVASARVSARAYARLCRCNDEFFAMDRRGLRSGSLAFMCRASRVQPSVGEGLETLLEFLTLMLDDLQPTLVRQHSLAEIVLGEPHEEPRRAFTYFTFWMIVHGVACWSTGWRAGWPGGASPSWLLSCAALSRLSATTIA